MWRDVFYFEGFSVLALLYVLDGVNYVLEKEKNVFVCCRWWKGRVLYVGRLCFTMRLTGFPPSYLRRSVEYDKEPLFAWVQNYVMIPPDRVPIMYANLSETVATVLNNV